MPIASPPWVPDPLTFLTAEHYLNLGTDKLIFVPQTGFGSTTLSELLPKSADNAAMAMLQPVVNALGVGGGGATASAHAAAPAHASVRLLL